MLRGILVGVVFVSWVGACSSDDRPAVAAGAVAGKVVEVTGHVTASREGKPARPLQIGSEVYGDDQVATSADASVAIVLGHNNARWSVEGGKTARVDASLAWKLAKQEATGPVDHATTAAGRNAERSAADTQATARSAETSKSDTGANAAPEKNAEPVTAAAPQPMETPTAPPPPPPPPPRVEAPAMGGEGGGANDKVLRPKGAPAPRAAAEPVTDGLVDLKEMPKDAKQDDRIRVLVGKQRAALVACAAGAKLSLTIRVAKGKATFEIAGEASEQARTCIGKVVGAIGFPAVDGSATLELAK